MQKKKMQKLGASSLQGIIKKESSILQKVATFTRNIYTVTVRKDDVSIKVEGLTLDHKIPGFNDPVEQDFLKTLWKMEKMLVTSIFSFSNNVI